jgi:hypothetical protein
MYVGRQVWYLPFTIVAQSKDCPMGWDKCHWCYCYRSFRSKVIRRGLEFSLFLLSLNTINLDMLLVNQHLHWYHDKNQCWLVSVFGQYSFWVQLSGTQTTSSGRTRSSLELDPPRNVFKESGMRHLEMWRIGPKLYLRFLIINLKKN